MHVHSFTVQYNFHQKNSTTMQLYKLSLKAASQTHINKGECTGCEASMAVKTFY